MAGTASMSTLFAWTDGNNFHTAYFLFFLDHPLHSTAVDAYGEERSQDKSLRHVSALQRKNTEGRSGKK